MLPLGSGRDIIGARPSARAGHAAANSLLSLQMWKCWLCVFLWVATPRLIACILLDNSTRLTSTQPFSWASRERGQGLCTIMMLCACARQTCQAQGLTRPNVQVAPTTTHDRHARSRVLHLLRVPSLGHSIWDMVAV